MKYRKEAALFALGGGAYVGLELLWRGRSHISMFGAGGLCFLLLGKLGRHAHALPLRALAGTGIITAVELGTGLLVNRDHRIWDYRNRRGNFRGQICPAYMLLWTPLALGAMGLYPRLEEKLSSAPCAGEKNGVL